MAFDSENEPSRPGRIIIPGASVAPGTAGPAAPASGSRLVLPPGAQAEDRGDLPEYPRLRPLEILAVRDGDRDMLLVSDPLGVMPAPVALRIEALELLRLLDGSVSLNDLSAAVMRDSKDLRAAGFVKDFVSHLDQMLMLESPRFDSAYAAIRHAYHQLEIRQTTLAGMSYPEDREELDRFLGAHFAAAETLRADAHEPVAAPGARPRGLLAPHLDPRRGGTTMARVFLELGSEQPGPLRVIVFATGHALLAEPFALTRKHFETPYGKLECDTAFVDALAAHLGEAAYRAELAHRDEHSIELQALYLKYRLRDRPVSIVPILCGGFHALLYDGKTPREDPDWEQMIAAVREIAREQGGATVYLAGVDLSHIGARFGDPPVDERTLGEAETVDRAALEAARRGDADGWYRAIADHEDSTRICGWSATYAMLRCAEPGEGRLLGYEQSQESNGSMVSIAGMVWE